MVARCGRCGGSLPVSEFARDRSKARGRKSICRGCDRAKSRAYYEANRERVLARINARNAAARGLSGGDAVRKCRTCGGPPTSQRHVYCDRCRRARKRHKDREREKKRVGRATPEQRGYGKTHRILRKAWAQRVAYGGVRCARCGELIAPGAPWDLGHDDLDRSKWTGPEHRACNRATATHAKARGQAVNPSRAW